MEYLKELNKHGHFSHEQKVKGNINYKLKEFDLLSSIQTKEFPTYYLRLNQRGGIQSFCETGNRLVYSSKQDYFDWKKPRTNH